MLACCGAPHLTRWRPTVRGATARRRAQTTPRATARRGRSSNVLLAQCPDLLGVLPAGSGGDVRADSGAVSMADRGLPTRLRPAQCRQVLRAPPRCERRRRCVGVGRVTPSPFRRASATAAPRTFAARCRRRRSRRRGRVRPAPSATWQYPRSAPLACIGAQRLAQRAGTHVPRTVRAGSIGAYALCSSLLHGGTWLRRP
mmetsp:Transcript_35972/g.94625  ORF Transcript_35972/g.94625 Transcript_35972/m.94625 type:complete len:200 (+) Transcript_35972:4331-4930(+)